MSTPVSRRLFARARRSLVGGVNSPVRAGKYVGVPPRFVARARGAHLWDADGRRYVDFVGSWGPAILGHAAPTVLRALRRVAGRGLSFGACCELEVALAEQVKRLVPGIDLVRMVNSGTEATMSAVRLARGVTGRPAIVKFAGCYHGHADGFLIRAGSGALTLGHPDSPGVTPGTARDTLVAPYNDLPALARLFARRGGRIAAVIVEPVAGNMGCVAPRPGFLEGMLRLCRAHGALSIFDEVMTGFRLGPAGAQGRFGLRPDLTTFGKVLGGGMPVGAFGGRREIMRHLAPEGPVYQAGTLSGNPPAMAAGLETLRVLAAEDGWTRLEARADEWGALLSDVLAGSPVPATLNRVGSMFCVYFHPGPVEDFAAVMASDARAFRRVYRVLLDEGVWAAPSPYEAGFVSLAHTARDFAQAARAWRRALAGL